VSPERLAPIYDIVRRKIVVALKNWLPHDQSAHALISPWKQVFDPLSMENLLVRSIVPKLMAALRDVVTQSAPMLQGPLGRQQFLSPFHPLRKMQYDQALQYFKCVLSWEDLIPIHHFITLLENEFFPKWLQQLKLWLLNQPLFDEVVEWYTSWKSLFSADLVANERVRLQLNQALDLMNQAVSGTLS